MIDLQTLPYSLAVDGIITAKGTKAEMIQEKNKARKAGRMATVGKTELPIGAEWLPGFDL